jgi:hypothetical protein
MFWTIQYDPDRRHAQVSSCEKARLHVSSHEASLGPIVTIAASNKGLGSQQRPGVRSKV